MAILSDEFYYQPIRIDTINTRVFADLVAKEGDANGRGLLVTLTENGLMKDTTGITLILKWEHTSVGNQGLDNFEVVDLSKGLYKITYPTEMLNRGRVCAFIQIIDSGKLAGTRNIEITVDRGVGNDAAIESSDSFTALAQALIDVNSNKSALSARIDSVEQQLVDVADNTNAALQELGAHKASTENPHGVTKTQVGLGNVDNTSDANKPVSTATQTALNLKANKVKQAWITPTLLNGATGTVQYRKNDFGDVEFRGSLNGTAGASPFTMPAAYRPGIIYNGVVSGTDSITSKNIQVLVTGPLYITYPYGAQACDLSSARYSV